MAGARVVQIAHPLAVMIPDSPPPRWPALRTTRLKWTALGILVSLLFLWLSSSRVRWGELGAVVSGVHWWPWLPLAVAAYLLGHFVRGLRCRMIVSELAPKRIYKRELTIR